MGHPFAPRKPSIAARTSRSERPHALAISTAAPPRPNGRNVRNTRPCFESIRGMVGLTAASRLPRLPSAPSTSLSQIIGLSPRSRRPSAAANRFGYPPISSRRFAMFDLSPDRFSCLNRATAVACLSDDLIAEFTPPAAHPHPPRHPPPYPFSPEPDICAHRSAGRPLRRTRVMLPRRPSPLPPTPETGIDLQPTRRNTRQRPDP